MMAQKSFYDVLLVDQDATFDEIKLAFKRRALQVHPDKGGSKEEFHLVYQALETLADPAARKKYDHGLATTKTRPAPHASQAPHQKSKKRKREDKYTQPATSCKAKTKAKSQTFGEKSATFAGKAPGKPTMPTPAPAEPQSKQTKLLMKIRDLLKQLPREARNDVITNQFSQKQRVILERFMADNAATSSGTKCHSEAKALAPAADGKSAPNQPGFEIEAVSKAATPFTPGSSHGSRSVALPATKSIESIPKSKAIQKSSCATTLSTAQASDAKSSAGEAATTRDGPQRKGMKEINHATDVKIGEGCYALSRLHSKLGPIRNKKTRSNRKTQSSGGVLTGKRNSGSYCARIRFDSLEIRTGFTRELKTALEDLVILTSVKQKLSNSTAAGTFVERLQETLESCSAQHGRKITDLKLVFRVSHSAGRFIGCPLWSPCVRSLEIFGKMRSVLEPFREYAKCIGPKSVYALCSPVHFQDAWQRFQAAVGEAWEIAGVDSTAILQKIRSLYEAHAPFRIASLQRWEQQHMAREDKNRNRPSHWAGWERQQMAMEDENKHRPLHLQERNPTASLECWERRQMALEDKNEHRPKNMRKRNPTARLECWERRKMAMEDKNKHRRRQLHKSEARLSRQLLAVRKLIVRWGHMLKREVRLADKERQKVIRQRKAQQKKDQEERRRVEVLHEKRRREAERSRREWVRKRMRSDLTMDDILGQKDARAFVYSFAVYLT